jgi:DNA-binding transcriptional LysR family regulator
MDLKQFRYFKKLAAMEHLTNTAEDLFISQSTLSMAIGRLESELGVKLFDRIGRGMRLNAYGEAFLHEVNQALEHIDRGLGQIEAIKRNEQNLIRLITPTIMGFPGLMSELEAQCKDIQINAFRCEVDNIVPLFKNGGVDLCIIAMEITDPALEGCVLRKQEMGCVVSSSSPLAVRRYVTVAELAEMQFSAYPQNTTQRMLFNEMFDKKGFHPTVIFESGNFYELLRIVSYGKCAATIVYELYENYRTEGTHFLHIIDSDVDESLRLYWLKEGIPERPLVSKVKKIIQKHFAELKEYEPSYRS